jgi:hypothetical protein
VVLASAMAAVCISGGAQGTMTMAVQAPPPTSGTGAFAGGRWLEGTKGHAYSLVEKTTQVRTRSDGTVMTTHVERHEMRDSEGRSHIEIGEVKGGQFKVRTVILIDPVASTSTTLLVDAKTAQVIQFQDSKSLTPEQKAKLPELCANAEAYGKKHPALPSTVEDLQPETILGVYAMGTRRTTIIPARQDGNDRDIHIVEDAWTSPDLKVKMRSVTDDPRIGKTTTEVTELERSAPARELFQIPPDYKVNDPGIGCSLPQRR